MMVPTWISNLGSGCNSHFASHLRTNKGLWNHFDSKIISKLETKRYIRAPFLELEDGRIECYPLQIRRDT